MLELQVVATTLGLERCFCHFLRFEIRFEICFCLRTKFPSSGLSELRQRNENINRESGSQKETPGSHTASENFPPSLKTVQWIPSYFICFTLELILPVPYRVKSKGKHSWPPLLQGHWHFYCIYFEHSFNWSKTHVWWKKVARLLHPSNTQALLVPFILHKTPWSK